MRQNNAFQFDTNLHFQFNKGKAAACSLAAGAVVCALILFAALQFASIITSKERIDAGEKYLHFIDCTTELISTGEQIATSYEAFLHTDFSSIKPVESEAFLANLMKGFEVYLQVVGVVEDTTILFTYPQSETAFTPGTDLAFAESHREDVLRVKNELVSLFRGPVPLQSGGEGYIARVPLTDTFQDYWGQVTFILDAEKINRRILELSDEANLEVAVFTDEDTALEAPILGSTSLLERDPSRFLGPNNTGWIIYALPKGGWGDYRVVYWLITAAGILFGLGTGVIVYQRSKSNYLLAYSLTHDPLTDLYNRRYLAMVQKYITAKAAADRWDCGLLQIDLDNLKMVNDEFGHHAGDEVLECFGKLLKLISRSNELVFRIGGDEFMIIIPEIVQEDELECMRKRFEKELHELVQADVYKHRVEASIGIALFPKEGYDFDEVMKEADKDMYRQKALHKAQKHKVQTQKEKD